MASRSKNGFFDKSELWAGTTQGILKFDGEQWVNYYSVTLQGNAKIKDAVRTYVGTERGLDEYTRIVKAFNDVKNADDESHVVEVKMPWDLVVKDTITAILYKRCGGNLRSDSACHHQQESFQGHCGPSRYGDHDKQRKNVP